jgi:hypothetical protein
MSDAAAAAARKDRRLMSIVELLNRDGVAAEPVDRSLAPTLFHGIGKTLQEKGGKVWLRDSRILYRAAGGYW